MGEKADAYRKLADEEDNIEEVEQEITRIKENMEQKWLESQPIKSHDDIAKDYANFAKINLTL